MTGLPMMPAGLRVAVADRVCTITIDRPAKLNTMTPDMGRAMFPLSLAINDDDDIRVVILQGEGERAFSAGSDVSALDGYGTNWQLRNRADYCRAIWQIRKPVIAGIRGWCIGGGLEMALMSDIRIAGESARFGAGEIKLGWHGGAGNTQLLPRAVGPGRALEMLLTGDHIDASDAHATGLIQHVYPDDEVLQQASLLAGRIATNAPIAAQMAKHLVRIAASTSLDVGLAYENDSFAYLFTTDDSREGRQAFGEKRPPEFLGR